MSKHLETLVAFKYGTKRLANELKDTVVEISGDLHSAIKKLCYAILIIVMWLIGLVLVILLPIGTWLRLKSEKEHEVAIARAKREYMERRSLAKRSDHE